MLPLLVSIGLHSSARANVKTCLFGGVENVSLKPCSCGLTSFLILCELEQDSKVIYLYTLVVFLINDLFRFTGRLQIVNYYFFKAPSVQCNNSFYRTLSMYVQQLHYPRPK